MSTSLYLICDATEQYVRVAHISGSRASATPHPDIVAMFCEVHQGLFLRSDGEAPDWKSGNLGDKWTLQNVAKLYAARTGKPLPTRWKSALSRPECLMNGLLLPKALADQRGKILGQMTRGAVQGEAVQIESVREPEDSTFQFDLVGKYFNGYRFKVMTFSHSTSIYPVVVRLDESIAQELGIKKQWLQYPDLNRFEEFFERLLKSYELNRIINFIIRESFGNPVEGSASSA